MDDQLPNLSFLTEEEKSQILKVLEKDDYIRRKTTEKRIKLREEIDLIESRSIDIPSEHVESARVCIRCRDAFGYFFNTGAFCPKCGFKVCSKCRVNQTDKGLSNISWLCILCHKYYEYMVQTGEWIHLNSRKNSEEESIASPLPSPKKMPTMSTSSADSTLTVQNLQGSQLIKLSLIPNSKSEIIEEIEQENLASRSTLTNPYLKLTKSKSQNLTENHSPRQFQKTVIARQLIGSTSTTPTSSRSSSVNQSPEMQKQALQQRYNTLQYRTQTHNMNSSMQFDHSKNVPVLSMANSTSNLQGRNPFFSTSNNKQPLQKLSSNDVSRIDRNNKNLMVSNTDVDFASVTSSEVDSSRSDLAMDELPDKRARSANRLDNGSIPANNTSKTVPDSLNSTTSPKATKSQSFFDSVPAISQMLSSPWTTAKNESKFVFPSASSNAIKTSADDTSTKLAKSLNLEKKTSFSKNEDLRFTQSFGPGSQKKPVDSVREPSPSKQSNMSANSNKSSNSLKTKGSKKKEASNPNSDTDGEEMIQMDKIFETYRESTRGKDNSEDAKKDPLNQSTKSFTLPASPKENAIDADESLFSSDDDHHSNSNNTVAKSNKLSFRLPKHMSLIKRKRSNPLQRTGSTRSVDGGGSAVVSDGFTQSEMESHLNGKSKVCLEFSFEKVSSNLSIRIISCQDLSCMNNKKNSCDAYVKLYLIVDNKEKKDSKRKTSIKKNTCNPRFDEIVRYTLSHSEVDAHKLWISVWNSDTFGRNKLLGDVYVQLSSKLFDQKPRFFDLNERLPDDVIYE